MSIQNEVYILLQLGLILLTGYLFGNLAEWIKLPRVSGYILAGVLMSPSLLGVIDKNFLESSDLLTHASLSVITFLIGSSLTLKKLRTLGKKILFITIGEAELAFITVSVAVGIFLVLFEGESLTTAVAVALLFGSLASPTDPASTLAVMHQYKARGPLTTTILGVTALDDITGIINFTVGYSLAISLLGAGLSLTASLGSLLYQVFGAVLLGVIGGASMHLLGKFARERKEIVTLTFGVLFIVFSVAKTAGVDELLATMTTGIALVNMTHDNERFREPLENYIEDILFTAFFVVGSAYLELKVLIEHFPLILLYVGSRFAGKYVGSYLGGHVSEAPENVKKYIAFALFPQGGIVIGLALLASQNDALREYAPTLVNVVIGSTVIHELIGPILSRFALFKAGEIKTTL